MSVRVMSWVWDHSTASGVDLLVMLAIADNAADHGGDAWPSTSTLARKCRVSERTVQRVVQRLDALGLLVVEWSAGPRGTNRYRIVLTPPSDCHPRQVDAPDTGVTTPPTTVSGEPSLNHPLPPQPPASGGSSAATACKNHRRPRRGCADCATPAPFVPEWCGGCESPDRRFVETADGRPMRCPTCHPIHGAWARHPPPGDGPRDPDHAELALPRGDR